MLILITGNGKGKTTAAIGQAIRAVGHGKKVFFAQFIKSDSYPSGEDEVLRGFKNAITFVKGGKGFVGILDDKLPLEEHCRAARETLTKAESAATSGIYDLVVLDEVNVAVSLGLISMKDLFNFLDCIPAHCDVVLTGRNASKKIIERADLVTECVEIKHPFSKKGKAKKGIDY